MEITPLGKRLLIKRDEFVKQVGQIELPGKRPEYSQLATVIAVGDDPEAKKFAIGDRLLITPWAGITIYLYSLRETLDESIRIITTEEIMATVKE